MAELGQLVQVRSPDGQIGSVPKENLSNAIRRGYVPLSAKEIAHIAAMDEAAHHPVIAGLESGASAATFGLSREVENASGITTPEKQALRHEANPFASGFGTVLGIGVPLALSAGLAAPELVAGEIAADAAPAAKAAFTAADVLNPVAGVAKVGSAVSESIAPAVASATEGLAANYPRVAALANKVIPGLSAGAAEGAAFGVGQSIDEHALGDPQALGEHLISNIGINALVGGAVGSIFGAFAKDAAKKIPTAVDVLENAPPPAFATETPIGRPITTFEDSIKYGNTPDPATKKSILDGLTKLKKNAPEITGAADHLGVPAFAGQLSDSPDTKRFWSIQFNSPSPVGLALRQEVKSAYEVVHTNVENAIRSDVTASAADVGKSLRESFLEKANAMIDSYSSKYQELGLTERAIPVNEKSLAAITRNISKIPEIKGNIAPAFASQMEGRLATVQTLEDLTTQIKGLNADIYSHTIGANEKRIAIVIKDKLQNLYENTIRKQFSSKDQKELFALYKDARKEFAESVGKLGELASGAGKSRIKSPRDFVNFISDKANADTLVDKLFKKNDSEFTSFLQEKFPKEWEMIKGYQRAQIAEYKDGVLNLNGALKKIHNMEPELKKAVFDAHEIKTLEAAKTWSDSFPPDVNPSGTAHTLGWMNYLKNPAETAFTHIRDLGIKAGLSGIEHSSGNTAKITALARIQKATEQTKNAIEVASRSVFSEKGKAGLIGIAHVLGDDKEALRIMDHIDDISSNPQKMMDDLHNNTNDLYRHAPGTSAGVQQAMVSAVSFLSMKMPKPMNQRVLSPKYKIPKSQMFKFNGYINTIKSPVGVLRGIRHGMVTSDQMETLRAVYPQMLGEMQMSVMEQLADHLSNDKDLPYATKIGLSTFLERDLTNSMSQQSIAMNQMPSGSGQTENKNTLMNSTQKGLQSLTMSDRTKTGLDKISDGDES